MTQPLQASLLEGVDLVAILNTGVTGFAVLMLFISYRLIAGSQKMVIEKDVKSFPDHETFTGWRDLVKVQVRQTYVFMLLAFLFFGGGLGALLYQFRPESDVFLSMQPFEEPLPRVFVGDTEITFLDSGRAKMRVSSDRTIEVQTNRMHKRVTELEARLAGMEAELAGARNGFRQAAARSASDESGL